jgi:hypothetical protein
MITPSIHRHGNRLDFSDFDLSVVSFLDTRTINPVEKNLARHSGGPNPSLLGAAI